LFAAYIYAAVSKGNRKPRRLSLICSRFAHHAKQKIDVCPFIEEENTEVIHLQTDLPVYACEITNVAYPYP
jgi:hypothetical protein